MTDILAIKAAINAMTVFQVQEIQRAVNARMGTLGFKPAGLAAPAASPFAPPGGRITPASSGFKRGDLVEFYAAKRGGMVRLIIDRINTKTLGGHEAGAPHMNWRVSPSLCRLVGADKMVPPAAPEITATPADVMAATPRIPSHVPSAPTGRW